MPDKHAISSASFSYRRPKCPPSALLCSKAGGCCQLCKVKAVCRKRAEYNLELGRCGFEMPSTLEDNEIEAILSKVDTLESWAGDAKERSLQQTVSGKK